MSGGEAGAAGEALPAVGAERPRHLIIDPFQRAAFHDAGWDVLAEAGLGSVAELIAEPSSLALPRLFAEGVVADAAFVDGSHRFHEVFVDLYFLRKIVKPGGLIVLDDDWTPSVRTALHYYERNLGWTVIAGAVPADARIRGVRLPAELSEPPFEDFHPFGDARREAGFRL